MRTFLLHSGRGAEYGDQFVSLSVSQCMCLSVCKHISGTVGPTLTKFFVQILWPWLSPPLAALRYVMHFRFYG